MTANDVLNARREQNVIYQIFRIVTGPVTRATRVLMPRFILDRHIPFVAFGLLLALPIILVIAFAFGDDDGNQRGGATTRIFDLAQSGAANFSLVESPISFMSIVRAVSPE